ncbi:kinase-like protein, partial [Ramaria rubella]
MLATHAKLPTFCAAVKVVSRSGLLVKAHSDPTALHLADAVIHREVLLMKLAAHQRILKLYDFVGHGDLVYMVLEHAPNKTLFDLFRTSTSYLPPPLVHHIFSQVMQGLSYTHDLRIVHRDIKLENIFVFGPSIKTLLRHENMADLQALHVKIGDFGLSHIDDPDVLSTVFHGSPHYQAPELWARVPHHALPTDIWSAGVVLYALQCRSLPFGLAHLEDCAAIYED